MKFLKALKSWAYKHASKYFGRAILVEGVLDGTDQTFRSLFIGDSLFLKYLVERMYSDTPCTLRAWSIWMPSLKSMIQNPVERIDLCVAIFPENYERYLPGMYSFKSHEFVRQMLNVSGAWEDIRRQFHRNPRETERKIRKYNLSYRITHRLEDYDFFYERMFLPHIKKQFGSIAYIDTYEDLKSYFLKGFLLLVVEGEHAIAAGLSLIEDDRLTFRRIGVLDGEDSYVKKGGQSALYYFTIQYAREQGAQVADFMKSRPFLNDGIYRHKSEWGAAVYPDKESEAWVYFFNLGSSGKIARFFELNPLVVHTKTGLKGVVGLQNGLESSSEVEKDLTDRFYAPGLEGLLLLTPKSKIPIEISFSNNKHSETLYTQ